MTLRIKEVIKEKGLTIENLSEMLQINRVTLSKQIHGNPTVETLQRLAEVLQVDIRELFVPSGTKDPADPIEAMKEIRTIAENVILSNQKNKTLE